MAQSPHIEVEFKLRATGPLEVAAVDAHLREHGLACRAADLDEHLDVYLDDDRHSLQRSGIGLRLRRSANRTTLTCKRGGTRNGAKHEREEIEAPWSADEAPKTSAQLPEPIRMALAPVLSEATLSERLRLAVRRERRLLQQDGIDLCEVAIDRVVAEAGARRATFDEIEIEVSGDAARCEQLCDHLTKTLPVAAAETDKPTHAATLLGMSPDCPPPPTATADTVPATGNAVLAAIDGHLVAMQDAEHAIHERADAEPTHELRVALRRLRTLVKAFDALWPDDLATSLRARLAAFSHRLDSLRDLDVLLANSGEANAALPEGLQAAAATVTGWLQRERDQEHCRVREWLKDPGRRREFSQLVADLHGFSRDGSLASEPMSCSLADRLASAGRKVRKRLGSLSKTSPLSALHAARLSCKRLRYLAEERLAEGAPSIPGKLLAALTRAQRSLGRTCDHSSCSERLLLAASRLPTDAPPASLAALGGLATWHAEAGRRLTRRATKHCRRLESKRFWRWLADRDTPQAPQGA